MTSITNINNKNNGASIMIRGMHSASKKIFFSFLSIVNNSKGELSISALSFLNEIFPLTSLLFTSKLTNEDIVKLRDELGLLEPVSNFSQRIIQSFFQLQKNQLEDLPSTPPSILLIDGEDESHIRIVLCVLKGTPNLFITINLKKLHVYESVPLEVKQSLFDQATLLHPLWEKTQQELLIKCRSLVSNMECGIKALSHASQKSHSQTTKLPTKLKAIIDTPQKAIDAIKKPKKNPSMRIISLPKFQKTINRK